MAVTPQVIETFSDKWCPRLNASAEVSYRTRKAQFSDGYAQVAGDGINPKQTNWSLDFVSDEAKTKLITAFLDKHSARKAFKWKTPLGDTQLFRCESYKVTAMGKTSVTLSSPQGTNFYSISATFIQTFAP
ncbi:hypothetical protein SB5439_04983 [Klebsiella variicola]|uniref:phage tail protein n=1 Tax=Klebsiella variicola TaxID=244366 RepID=UPI0010E4BE58|nr:phage tail protein [Klebsiella variicola]VGQ11689.1 hypothetical protein SB5439_04983 [Klebsiella variicola]